LLAGLPPSPPSIPSGISSIDDGPNPGRDNNGMMMKPLGVAVPKKEKERSNGRMIFIIVMSSITVFVLFLGLAWLCLLKYSCCIHQHEQVSDSLKSPAVKPLSKSNYHLGKTFIDNLDTIQNKDLVFYKHHKNGIKGCYLIEFGLNVAGVAGPLNNGFVPGSGPRSFDSGTIAYIGSAKNFTLNDLEKATNNFDSSRILGEGGFGLVYKGILNDGRDVAVKILKRDDRRGGREFLAEVEMLSRLHHRNLVKLIGICIEKQTRCLVYELVPNGSVESHLHGKKNHTPQEFHQYLCKSTVVVSFQMLTSE
jgi:hypothetical protein